ADDDVRDIRMLEDHARLAGRDAETAVGALLRHHDIGAVLAAVDRPLGTDLHTLAALRAYPRAIDSRLREVGCDLQRRLPGVDVAEMADRADLPAQAAAGAVGGNDFDSLYRHIDPYGPD